VITAEQWYAPNPELQNYYQGDVLSEIPFPTLPTFLPAGKQDVWGILRPRPNRTRQDNRPLAEVLRNLPNELIGRAAKDLVDAWSDAQGEHVISHCHRLTVMLVSRSCDVDKHSRKHFLVAPVIAIESLQDAQKTDEKLRDLRANNIFHWFYLPATGKLPESYADLSLMVPLHRSFFDQELLKTSLLARLSGIGTAELQSAFSNFYGAKFGFSPPDTCPEAGHYTCSSCFYSGHATPQAKDFTKGNYFGDCPVCGEGAMWVKIPH
jgi:hypothetical protein